MKMFFRMIHVIVTKDFEDKSVLIVSPTVVQG